MPDAHKPPPICNTPGRKVPPSPSPDQDSGAMPGTDLQDSVPREALNRGPINPGRTLPQIYHEADEDTLPDGYLLPPGWTMADVRRMDEELLAMPTKGSDHG